MGRSAVEVRRVEGDLRGPFIDLWVAHRIESGTTPDAARRLAADGTLSAALDRSDICAFIAHVDGTPAGYVVVTDSTRSPLVDAPCVSISMLHVLPDHRRQGVAAALLARTVRYADQVGAVHVASLVPAHDRESNRFFARIGFAPETVRRVTSVATLQRRLAGERSSRRPVAQVLQRRRDLRARARSASPRGSSVGLG
ncbi:MAG: GNAT family N-acetyltransferase [Intrasporangium sp.]|uniref:GNAT family N-acetyltransferase n=1 Tax=Intrasporangium sp. TaxID=1925024 RepID=UPI002648C188|nr:GNAT family N-acetyltransferase [Intrasporangium sp.]MDN5795678.1 GNAT family N-acetyltransferase [Intrasporangium sp.]